MTIATMITIEPAAHSVTRPAYTTIIDAGIGDVTVAETVDGVSLGLGILKHLKKHRWVEVFDRLPDDLELTADQRDLLDRVEPVLCLVANTVRRDGRSEKGIKIQVCCECGRWLLFCGTAPTKCRMAIGCTGRVVTVKPGSAS